MARSVLDVSLKFPFCGSLVVPFPQGQSGMKGKRITKRLIDSLNPTGREFFVWDSKLPGFGVRVQRSGVMSYVTKYRAGSVGRHRHAA